MISSKTIASLCMLAVAGGALVGPSAIAVSNNSAIQNREAGMNFEFTRRCGDYGFWSGVVTIEPGNQNSEVWQQCIQCRGWTHSGERVAVYNRLLYTYVGPKRIDGEINRHREIWLVPDSVSEISSETLSTVTAPDNHVTTVTAENDDRRALGEAFCARYLDGAE